MKETRQHSYAYFLIVILAGGIIVTAAGLVESAIDEGGTISGSWIDGSVTDAVDQVVENGQPLRAAAIALAAATRFVLFRDASGEAVVGRDGWLFSLEEFQAHDDDAHRLAASVAEISSAARQLEERGIELLVALVPSKARQVPGRLAARWQRLAEHPRLDRAVVALEEAGVSVVDLRASLGGEAGEERFFARDTHWTPDGARAAAAAIAATAGTLGIAPDRASAPYERAQGDRVTVDGDLMAFVPVGRLRHVLDLPPESAVPARATGGPPAADGLFGEVRIPVSLVGTSFSQDDRWGFADELVLALQADVLNVAARGEGPFVPMREYLAGDTIRDTAPDLVVWEIPERYLTVRTAGSPLLE